MKFQNLIYLCMLRIFNKLRFFIISVLLMLAGILVFYGTFYTFLYSVSNILNERHVLGSNHNNIYKIESKYISFAYDKYYENYRDFLIEQRKKYPIGVYWTTSENLTNNFDSHTITQMQQMCPDLINPQLPDELMIPTLIGDCSLLNSVGIHDMDGNPIDLSIRDNGYIEIAIGASLSKWIHIGDVLTANSSNKKFIVTSIIAENSEWVQSELLNNDVQPVPLNCYIIEPINLSDYTGEECTLYINNVYLCEKNAKTDISNIEKSAQDNNIYIDILSMSQAERHILKENNQEFQFSIVLVCFMMITVITIITILSVLSWLGDSHDIGILYANGFSNKDIFLLMVIINLIKFIFAGCISFILLSNMTMQSFTLDNYKYIVYFVILLILLILVIISAILSYIVVNRMSPCNLLKGERFD
ncbi:MAG TPA: hypothetical protein DHV96_07345 [Lachnospiraceae bacterium]|nr:hypothetical protein [Lachnospiraceae bacterium]